MIGSPKSGFLGQALAKLGMKIWQRFMLTSPSVCVLCYLLFTSTADERALGAADFFRVEGRRAWWAKLCVPSQARQHVPCRGTCSTARFQKNGVVFYPLMTPPSTGSCRKL
jgi:hypothetical protein